MTPLTFDAEVTKNEWEAFLLSQEYPQFLQSYNMRTMHEALGEEVVTIAMRKEGQIIGGFYGEVVRAKRGHFLYLPYGPVCTAEGWTHFSELTAFLVEFGKKLEVDFLRSSPFVANTPENIAMYSDAGWKESPLHMLAEHLWWLDITPDEDALLKGMRKTMRNLIRRAERDGVTVRTSTDIADVEHFIEVHKDTVARHGFVPYTDQSFREQVKAFLDDDQVVMFLAEYEGKVISAGIMMYYGTLASYHHGASLSAYNKVPASYMMQWEAIQEGKRRGCTKYNFWGIAPEGHENMKKPHPLAGVGKFKQGFGGERYELLPCHDYPITPKYLVTKTIETIRKKKRGY